MTELRFETQQIPASSLGEDNALPDLRRPARRPPPPVAARPGAPDDPDYLRACRLIGCLPYRIQDGYDRSDAPRPFDVAVLENDPMRATFLLGLGGRLWSLVDKPSGRELLYQPDVLHFVNIGLRRAWFCGGVEWNIAMRGHTAHTCAPLLAGSLTADDGSPVLRMWEWDRFRNVAFQIDAFVTSDPPALMVRPRIVNPADRTVPMYWWSNIAVEQAEGHRVIAPADHAFTFDYDRNIQRIPVPFRDGVDVSYPTANRTAHDYFYDVAGAERPWITSVDPEGMGLIQTSTPRLGGRKLFVWGTGPGGRRWQEHLGGCRRGYVEIQAGLAATQADYVPMPARADWSWLEAYMLLEADPADAFSDDWSAAGLHVTERLRAMLPAAKLERMLADTAAMADRPVESVRRQGSGWGALELLHHRCSGEPADLPAGMAFDESTLGADQAQWLALLRDGALPVRPTDQPPGAWMTARHWADRLAASAKSPAGDHWLTWLHLGVALFRAGGVDAAAEAWRTSIQREPSAWAYRNLAVVAANAGRADEAADLFAEASRLMPGLYPLQVECGAAMLEAGRAERLGRWLDLLPDEVRRTGRMQLLEARAAFQRGELESAEAILRRVELPDVREGETALTDLWFAIQAARISAAEGVPVDDELERRVRRSCPPPAAIDFRMA